MAEITLKDYTTNQGVDRAAEFPVEWALAETNAIILLAKVNSFLDDVEKLLGIVLKREVSSGFRPEAVNATTTGASKTSLHMRGKAVDIRDDERIFKNAFQPLFNPEHAQLLRSHGLFMEHPDYTKRKIKGKIYEWFHLDDGDRVDRPTRTFVPY